MLLPLQFSPSANRPNSISKKHAPLRFGKLDESRLKSYKIAIQNLPDFGPNEAYGQTDFSKIYNKLKPRAQKHLEKLCKQVSPEEVAAMEKANVLGVIEESADMLFELDTLIALRKGLITAPKVDEWCKNVMPGKSEAARSAKPFETVLKEIDKDIPNNKAVQQFEKAVGWQPQRAHEMLLLIATKFMLMRDRDPNYQLWKESKHLLWGEAKELMEPFPRFSPRKLQIAALALTYTYIPGLPANFFKSQLEGIVSNRLKTPIHSNDLIKNVYGKQLGRQEYDYYNPQLTTNKERKKDLKGIEVLNEAAVLKNARLWNPASFRSMLNDERKPNTAPAA